MAVKSIISVDVDKSQFDAFQENYNKYQEALSKNPAMWAAVGKENKSIAAGFKVMTASLMAQEELIRKQAGETKKLAQSTEQTSSHWKAMVPSTKAVLSNLRSIKDTTESILKFAGFGFILSSLGSIGSLFGFERLAAYANAARRSSTGLGVSAGEQSAFNVTFGRYVDTGTLLHGVSGGLGDISSPQAIALMKMGIIPGQGQKTADVSLEVLKKARDLANQYKDNERLMGTMARARGFGEFGIGVEELRRLRGMSDEDLKKYQERATTLGISDKSLKQMQEFDITLAELGAKIRNVLIDSLGNLATPLKRLTDAFGETLRKILGSQGFRDAIDYVSKELNKFADWVSGPDFKKDLADFASKIKEIAGDLVEAIRWIGSAVGWFKRNFGWLAPSKEETASRPDVAASRWIINKGKELFGSGSPQKKVPTLPDGTPITDEPLKTLGTSANLGTETDVDKLLPLVAKLEGSPDRNGVAQVSPAGAVGKFQIMPNTARGLGYDPSERYDPVKNKEMARKLLTELVQRYHGNVAEILADYNGGPKAVQQLREGQFTGGFKETERYLEHAGQLIKIENNTGGSAIVSAAGMSVPQ